MNAVELMKKYYDAVEEEDNMKDFHYSPIYVELIKDIVASKVDNYPLTGKRVVDDRLKGVIKYLAKLKSTQDVNAYAIDILIYDGYCGKINPNFALVKADYESLLQITNDTTYQTDVLDKWDVYVKDSQSNYLDIVYFLRRQQMNDFNFHKITFSHDEAYYDDLRNKKKEED